MEWMHDLLLAKRWLFVDELTSAQTQMRPPLLSCFNERRVGSLHFHPTTIVSAAANPPELAPNGSPLEPSICNRLYHHDWVFPSGVSINTLVYGDVQINFFIFNFSQKTKTKNNNYNDFFIFNFSQKIKIKIKNIMISLYSIFHKKQK